MKKIYLTAALLLSSCVLLAGNPQLTRSNVKEVVAAMTLDEKLHLVMGLGDANWTNPKTGNPTVVVHGIAGRTWDIPRLGIPLTIMADGPAGLRIDPLRDTKDPHFCTAFPTATAMASSWNTELVKEVGAAMGNEVKEYGCDVLLAPAMNIQRNPLDGRNFEYYSEDPIVSGNMGAALVEGLQSQGVGASVKHFVANNQETNRKSINEIISQRALREIYLRGFEIAIKQAKPWTVMTSYNRINGFHSAENRDLIQKILRGEWGYKGMLTTDWWSGTDATIQMNVGNDMLMPGCSQYEELKKALVDRRLDLKMLDLNVEHILQYIVKTPHFAKYGYSNKPQLQAHALIARQAAGEGMVLLKNENNTLPMHRVKTIALFGKTSYKFITGGTGSGECNYDHAVSLEEGLTGAKYKIDQRLETLYRHYNDSIESKAKEQDRKYSVGFAPEMNLASDEIEKEAKKSDLAIVTIGRLAGEGWDRQEASYFVLSPQEKSLISDVTSVYHGLKKKVIVVLNIGGPIETASWRVQPDAILLSWQTGQEGGNAIPDILKGTVNPSGKLAVSFPVSYKDVPSSSAFPGEPAKDPINSFYNDGIYVGYRYYDSFGVKPSFAFGYGLSYTSFRYSNLKLSSDHFNGNMQVEVTVENTGKYVGKEVAELYVSAPSQAIEKPVQELKGFVKTKLLKPGENQTVSFSINQRDLSSYWSGRCAWVADAGTYTVKIGSSSRDIRLQSNFTVDKELTETTSYAMQPNYLVKEISTKEKK